MHALYVFIPKIPQNASFEVSCVDSAPFLNLGEKLLIYFIGSIMPEDNFPPNLEQRRQSDVSKLSVEAKKSRDNLLNLNNLPLDSKGLPILHTPFSKAVTSNNKSAVKQLLAEGKSDVNWQGLFGNTPFHWAVANTNTEMALYLLDEAKGLDVNKQDNVGKTALHLSIGKGFEHFDDGGLSKTDEPPQAPVINRLLDQTNLTLVDETGNTPLHIALMRRDVALVELFLEKDISLFYIKNNKGETPLDMLRKNYVDVVCFIKRYVSVFSFKGADWDARGEKIYDAFLRKRGEMVRKGEFTPPADSGPLLSKDEFGKMVSPNQETSEALDEFLDPPENNVPEPTATFNQIVEYLNFTLVKLQGYPELSNIAKFLQELKLGIEALNQATNTMLDNGKILPANAKKLADDTFAFVQKVANLTVDENDIASFKKNNKTYHHISCKTLALIIGSALLVASCVAVGLLSNPDISILQYIPAVGCSAATAGFFGYLASNKYLLYKKPAEQSFIELENSAKNIVNTLGP